MAQASTIEETGTMRRRRSRTRSRAGRRLSSVLERPQVHMSSPEELSRRYSVDFSLGLTTPQIEARLAQYGPNLVTPPRRMPLWVRFLNTLFNSAAQYVFFVAAVVMLLAGVVRSQYMLNNLVIGMMFFLVWFMGAIFVYYSQAQREFMGDSMANLLPMLAKVLRNRSWSAEPVANLVPGDVIKLVTGDSVPADAVMISVESPVQVDCSSLTGESDPVPKSLKATDRSALEAENMLLASSLVVQGKCTAVVTATGDNCVLGQIAVLCVPEPVTESRMSYEVRQRQKMFAAWGAVAGLIVLVAELAHGGLATFPLLAPSIVGAFAGMMPQALTIVLVVAMTLAAQRMASHDILVKALETVETLGNATCIVTDKTGVMSQNRMLPFKLYFDLASWDCDTSISKASYNSSDPTFQTLIRVMALTNSANFADPPPPAVSSPSSVPAVQPPDAEAAKKAIPLDERVVVGGDPTDGALLRLVQTVRDVTQARVNNRVLLRVPYSGARKWSGAVFLQEREMMHTPVFAIKGEPTRVLARCTSIMRSGVIEPLSSQHRRSLDQVLDQQYRAGCRVLAFAQLALPREQFPPGFSYQFPQENFPVEGLCFLGLCSMLDPPRPSIPAAVAKCKASGIKVVMVTGDHELTAQTFAAQVGLKTHQSRQERAAEIGASVEDVPASPATSSIVLSGRELADLEPRDWDHVLAHDEIIFGTTSPHQKVDVVQRLQQQGHIVVATGSGAGDGPVLKASDVGVSLGIMGTDISKDAADVVLLDDSFAAMVSGIEDAEGMLLQARSGTALMLAPRLACVLPYLLAALWQVPAASSLTMLMFIELVVLPVLPFALSSLIVESGGLSGARGVSSVVPARMMSWAVLQVGSFVAAAGFFAWLMAWLSFGVRPVDLFTSNTFELRALIESAIQAGHGAPLSDMEVSLGLVSSVARHARTAHLAAVVTTMFAVMLVLRTRRAVFVTAGASWSLLAAFAYPLVILVILCYSSYSLSFDLAPIQGVHWLTGLPFAAAILVYEEARKAWVRRHPDGWLDRYASF